MQRNDKIRALSREAFPRARELRRAIHSCPELSEQEFETQKKICAELDALGIEYEKGSIGCDVVATVPGRDFNKAVGIRADIDALPIEEAVDRGFKSQNAGVMHACGHDIHTATLLGTAAVLKKLSDAGELPYSVKLFFQPAEETIGGARRMIEAGCLEKPDVRACIGLHVAPNVPVGTVQFMRGPMNSAMSDVFITVYGKGGHGAYPQNTIDPLIPACTIVTSLESMLTRRMGPFEPCVITFGKFNSGTAPNVIPDETRIEGSVRTMDTESRIRLEGYMKELCESTAAAFGARAEIRFENSDPALVNDDRLFELLLPEAEEQLGKERVDAKGQPTLGAEDFAYFAEKVPSLFFVLGTKREEDEDPAPIHSDHFDPDDACIETGIECETAFVLKLMEQERLFG